MDQKNMPLALSHYPLSLQIEITTACNLDCVMCEHSHTKENPFDLNFQEFRKIIDSNEFFQLINFTGIGESLLNKDFFNMIEYAKRKNIYVWFNSNFTLMTKDKAKKLIQLGTDAIAVSMDGARRETYEAIRRGAKFNVVKENIKNFQEIKKELKKNVPELFFVVVVMEENLSELKEFVLLAKELGIKKILFVGMIEFKGNESFAVKDKDLFEEKKQEILTKAEEEGIQIIGFPSERKDMGACYLPWNSLYINAEGKVLPCCFVMQRDSKRIIEECVMGNAKKQGIKEIWNSENYKGFREKLKSKNLPNICRNCPVRSSIF
ncbi:MAG: radical SAM protein [archaeon]